MTGMRWIWGWKSKRQDNCWREMSVEMGFRAQKMGWPWDQMHFWTIFPSFCPSIYQAIYPLFYPSYVHLFICLSIHLLVHSFAHSSNVLNACLVPAMVLDARVQWWVKNRCHSAPLAHSYLESLALTCQSHKPVKITVTANARKGIGSMRASLEH